VPLRLSFDSLSQQPSLPELLPRTVRCLRYYQGTRSLTTRSPFSVPCAQFGCRNSTVLYIRIPIFLEAECYYNASIAFNHSLSIVLCRSSNFCKSICFCVPVAFLTGTHQDRYTFEKSPFSESLAISLLVRNANVFVLHDHGAGTRHSRLLASRSFLLTRLQPSEKRWLLSMSVPLHMSLFNDSVSLGW
jgi:hypothetical protein